MACLLFVGVRRTKQATSSFVVVAVVGWYSTFILLLASITMKFSVLFAGTFSWLLLVLLGCCGRLGVSLRVVSQGA